MDDRSEGMIMTAKGVRRVLCDIADVTPDTPVRVEAGDETYAVFEVAGAYYVTQDLCTHGPGSLAEGFVEGSEIECPFHLGKFDIVTGQPTAAPCTIPLRTWSVAVEDGKITIDPREAR